MRFPLPVAALFLLASVATAATSTPPPVIVAISPTSGPATGGTNVVILGQNLDIPPNFACILPCPTTVLFDNTEVVPTHANEGRLDVKTPPHAPGVVPITVKTGDGRIVTAPAAFRYVGDAEAGYETILLPAWSDGVLQGANGSKWQTDLWLRNDGSTDVTLAPWICPENTFCLTVFPLLYVLKSGETVHTGTAAEGEPAVNPGRLLYITRQGANEVSAGLRLYDSSRSTLNAGTEVPLVREAQLRGSAIQLHNVPLHASFRVMLRIYEIAQTESRYRVNFYPEEQGQPQPAISSIELTAAAPDKGPFHVIPAFAQYGALTDLLNLPTIMPVRLRAEIVPLTPGARFWAFISVTNNETQHVTLITPQ